MAPLPGSVVRTVVGAPVDREPRAGTRPEDDGEHDAMARPGAIGRLGDRKAVGVVGGTHIATEHPPKVGLDVAAVHPGRRRALGDARDGVEGSGESDS